MHMKFLHSVTLALVIQVLLVLSLGYGGCLCAPLSPVLKKWRFNQQKMVVNGLHLLHFSAPRDLPFLAPLVQQTPWRPGPPGAVTHAPSPRSTRALEQDDDTGTTSHLVPADVGVTDVSEMSPKCGITPSCD